MTLPARHGQPVAAAVEQGWLAIIGIGEDGVEGLGAAARQRLSASAVVYGGKRHLDLVRHLIQGDARPWPSPIRAAISEIRALRGTLVAVLVSGDPFFHGMGSVLAEAFTPEDFIAHPSPSAFSLAAARLGWPLQDTEMLSLCGHPVETVIPLMQPGRRLLILSADETTPAAVAAILAENGFGSSRIDILEAMGGSSERRRQARADAFALADVARLNVIAVAVSGGGSADPLPVSAGLEDTRFEADGMLTKREIRAITLSSLAPRAGDLLWDIGTGSGSVAIEWLLAHRANRAIAIEHRADRALAARRNAAALGVPRLDVREGVAPAALMDLPVPDAVFIGGGLTSPGLMDRVWQALTSGGRLVANSVTLEGDQVLGDAVHRLGGSLTRIAVERLDRVGRLHGYRPAMTVTQYRTVKQ
ncbi:MAG: precorrin-6y C5,15-methyltransferase (decarboxylating) subunit CbiE [Rhodospirillaceae bacterium]|nr:precorrin-6y C5,15-methyltransferase (decarboxylating) subunit CbiE [Rhodospirillaceae bacterium]